MKSVGEIEVLLGKFPKWPYLLNSIFILFFLFSILFLKNFGYDKLITNTNVKPLPISNYKGNSINLKNNLLNKQIIVIVELPNKSGGSRHIIKAKLVKMIADTILIYR